MTRATITIEREGREVEVEVWGVVSRGSAGRWGGPPDAWAPPEPDEVEEVQADFKLTDAEVARAVEALSEAAREEEAREREADADERADARMCERW